MNPLKGQGRLTRHLRGGGAAGEGRSVSPAPGGAPRPRVPAGAAAGGLPPDLFTPASPNFSVSHLAVRDLESHPEHLTLP